MSESVCIEYMYKYEYEVGKCEQYGEETKHVNICVDLYKRKYSDFLIIHLIINR